MQDSPEQRKNSVPQEPKSSSVSLELGHQVYARHLGFPAASSMGASVANRLAWFSADRLPLARSVLQRWSVGEGAWNGLPNLQWLSDFALARRNTAEASVRPPRVAHVSAPSIAAEAMPVTAGETYLAPAAEVTSVASSANGFGSAASPPVRGAPPSRIERAATPILRSADARTAKTTRSAEQLSRSVSDISSMKPVSAAANPVSKASGSGVAVSGTDAVPLDRSVNAALTSSTPIQPSFKSAETPVLHSSHNKSAKTRKVQSTILESVHQDLFRPLNPTSVPLGHDIRGPIKVAAPGTEFSREVNEKESVHVEPAVGRGGPDIKMGADRRTRAEGEASILRTVEPTHAGSTYVGRPIFRRTLGGGPRTSLPANVFRSPEGLQDSGIPARSDHPQSTLPRVLHTVGSSKNTFSTPHEGEPSSTSRSAMPDHPPTVKPAGEISEPKNNNKVEASANNTAAGSESVSHALPVRTDVERSIGSPSASEGDTFVLRSSSVTTTPTSQITRVEADKDSGVQVPSRIHAQLSSNTETAQTTAGVYKLSKVHQPSDSESSAMESTSAGGAGAISAASAPEGKPVLSSLPSSSLHPELMNHVLPARGGIERSTDSSASSAQHDTFAQRASFAAPAQASQRTRTEATKNPGGEGSSRMIHAQLSLSQENFQPAAGAHKSSNVQDPSHSGSPAMEFTSVIAADPIPSNSAAQDKLVLSSLPSSSLSSVGRVLTPISPNSGGRVGQRLHDATIHQGEAQTTSTRSKIKIRPVESNRSVPLVPLAAWTNQSAIARRDETAGENPSVTHFIPGFSLASSSMDQAPQGSANSNAADAMTAAAARPIEHLASLVASRSMTPSAGVLRSAENEPLRLDRQNTALKLDLASGHPILTATTRAEKAPASLLPTIVPRLGYSAARQTETSLLRQSLPIALPRLSRVIATPALHRLASAAPSSSVHESSAYVRDAENTPQSLTLTHRAVAIDQLQRTPEPNLTGSFPRGVKNSYPLIDRVAGTAGAATGVSVPTLPAATPAATIPSGGTPPRLKNAEITQLANRVYELLVRRLASERQRRGQ